MNKSSMNISCFENKIHEIAKIATNNFYGKEEFSLLGGNCGIVLFLFYYSKWSQNLKIHEFAKNQLNLVISEIENLEYIDWTLDSGLSGLTYTIEHLASFGFIPKDAAESLSDYDHFFHKIMLDLLWQNNYDYFTGGLGIGNYFLSRRNFPEKEDYLIDLIGVLYKTRKKLDNERIAWCFNQPNTIKSDQDEFDLGIPHGLSGIIILLSKLYNKGINRHKIRLLLEPLVTFLLSCKTTDNNQLSLFPTKWHQEYTFQPSRLAWCYGDLGIAVSLWFASQSLGRKDWQEEAVKILLYSSCRRNLEDNGVVDAGLCHGTAGIGHIFNRMYRYTNLIECKDAADYWFEQTLIMAKFSDGFAGYKAVHLDGLVNEVGLLEGISGIGLALISYISDIEPTWDECLLLS